MGLMLLLYVLLRTSLLLVGSDWRFNEWRRQRRSVRAQRQTTRGLLALAQGRWRREEKKHVMPTERKKEK